jgi:hypothetical protein
VTTISTSSSLSGAFPTPPQRPAQAVQAPPSDASSSRPFNAEAVNKEMDQVGTGLWKPILGIAVVAGAIGAGIKHFNPDKAFSALDLALDASGKHIPQWGQAVLTGLEVAGLSLTAGAMTDWGLRNRLKHRNKQIEQLQIGKEPETGLFEEKPSSAEAVMARSQKKDFGFNPMVDGTLQALPLALADATIFGGSVILVKQHWKTNALLNCVLPVLGAVGISALTFSQVVPKLQAIQAKRVAESQGLQHPSTTPKDV